MLANRRLVNVLMSPLRRRNYRALVNMYRLYPDFPGNLHRYVLEKGAYPYVCAVRTPVGLVRPTLYSSHDLLTLNEVFCREDYFAPSNTGVVVDVGSNIGISALYFLTRNQECRCYLYEPVQRNRYRLRLNLADYKDRYVLHGHAVSGCSGVVSFGIESTGRYGGIGRHTGESIEVECRSMTSVLEDVIAREGRVDILKIDIEGLEIETVRSIRPELLERIRWIYFETPTPPGPLHSAAFEQRYRGNMCLLRTRHPIM